MEKSVLLLFSGDVFMRCLRKRLEFPWTLLIVWKASYQTSTMDTGIQSSRQYSHSNFQIRSWLIYMSRYEGNLSSLAAYFVHITCVIIFIETNKVGFVQFNKIYVWKLGSSNHSYVNSRCFFEFGVWGGGSYWFGLGFPNLSIIECHWYSPLRH
jgi:hypothetical protein